MANLKIEIVTKKLIKPSIPTPNHLQKLNLSLFDQLAPKTYSSSIYYYSGGMNNAEKCSQLEKSLSDTLVCFYPLAGRFTKDDFSIDCRDQGVEFWQARVSCELAEFLRHPGPEIEAVLEKFLPWEIPQQVDSATSPQLAIQAASFDDGGMVLGVRVSHILVDAGAMSLFMNSWTRTCRDDSTPPVDNAAELLIHHEIARVFPAMISSPGFNFPNSSAPPPPRNVADSILTRRFFVSSALITRIKDSANATANGERRPPSRVVAVLALVWKALMGVSVAKHGHLRDSILSLAMNLRGKISQGILLEEGEPFGNFCISVIAPFVASKASWDVVLNDLIILLTDTIADASAKIAKASRDDLATMFVNSRTEQARKMDGDRNGLLDVYLCSSLYRALPVYETDFGWGKPIWVSPSTQAGQGVCLMDSRDDGAEVWVSLKQTEMVSFQQQFHMLVASVSNLSNEPCLI